LNDATDSDKLDDVELPNISDVLRPFLQTVPEDKRPLLYAAAERMAAERYRAWAEQVQNPSDKAGLLECAGREDEIAARIESLYLDRIAIQDEIASRNPELAELTRSLFAPYSLRNQFRLQAQGERLGAAIWRTLAEKTSEPKVHEILLGCAFLEEASAEFLESLAGS
jgi:hypothetical protein